ncbi:MAG: hypothetical protein LBF34_00115 [Puniceicoccales bacterium]|jgi:hypothetical protein|nr:hypothetical protein [Puniceicoccales bacterium]
MNTNIQKIIGLGLLFGMHSIVVADDTKKLIEALDLLKKDAITVGDIFTEADVDLAWDASYAPLTKNVVRINMLDIENGLLLPYIGTGTLVDVGVSELRGRVIITCQHCSSINIDPNVENIEFTNIETTKTMKAKHSKQLQGAIPGNFLDESKEFLLSVTPECERLQENPVINTVDDHKNALQDNPTDNYSRAIAVTDVYVLDEADFCVMILEKPVKFNGAIVPGISLQKLNVMNLTIDNNGAHIQTALDETPIVIGYGFTGIKGVLSSNIVGTLEDAVKSNKLQERQNLSISLGWNIKKAIRLRGIDFAGQLQGCICKQWGMGSDLQYAYTMAGGAFSGSLIVKQNGNSYDVYGIYSGPLWDQNVKDFITGVAQVASIGL